MWRLNTYSGLPERTSDEADANSGDEAVSTEFNTSKFGNFLEVHFGWLAGLVAGWCWLCVG